MYFLRKYSIITKKDFLLKFYYDIPPKKFPAINRVILSFNFINSNFCYKTLILMLTVLEVITNKKAKFIVSKKYSLLLKVKKGQPIGCKIVLKKNRILFFLKTLLLNDNDSLLYNGNLNYKKLLKQNNSIVAFSNLNLFKFNQKILEDNYHLFRTLPKLNVLVISNLINIRKFLFLLKSYKFTI